MLTQTNPNGTWTINGVSFEEVRKINALNAVAEKYPDWKSGTESKASSGFKVGKEPEKKTDISESRLNAAFGLKRKDGK